MKKTLLAVALASVVLAIPSYADEQKPASSTAAAAKSPLPEFFTKDTVATLTEAGKQLRAALGSERNAVKQLDAYARFRYSAELQPKLKEIFGTGQPFPLERVAGGAKGQINYVGKLAPYLFVQGNGTDFSWAELTANISTDKTGRAVSGHAAWPSLVIARPEGSARVLDMSMVSKQQRGADGIGYGSATFRIGSISFRENGIASAEGAEKVRLEDLEARSDVTRRGAMVEVGYRTSIKAVVVGDQRIDRSNFALRITNIPAKAMTDLDKTLRGLQDSKLETKAQQEQMLKTMKDFGKRVAIAGATLNIDDISAAYRGNVAAIKGSVGFQKVVEADFGNVATLMKKVVARFEVRVPVALVKDIARAFATKSVDPSSPDAAKQIDAGADGMASAVVGKAVSGGYALVEKDELRSIIEIKNSKLIINGKEIDISKQVQAISGKIAESRDKPAPAPQAEPAQKK